ncbi:CRM-domain containing factor CFM3, chloroplastic/mitochondrial isoform X2 [Punica granatum]|uniref:CRM-domain containing factor CFM3, chloroplastic/mitochondrial isoform X2 n=1 Tax=Punica granatum TaxID=22663 RepID=A0A218XEJ6_PUNGR|nr:CRM-domain containing factor CFM3, chloroplastic/mitochondrial isoform X2 [Punica granatum]OWM83136.1 hypothetical protein CDL15_Pgr011818 [Punica granatum]
MAPSPFSLSCPASTSSPSSIIFSSSSSSPSLYILLLPYQNRSAKTSNLPKLRISCSRQTLQFDTESDNPPIKAPVHTIRKKRKPKPSFLRQIQDKWSLKLDSNRENFPWQQREEGEEQGEAEPQQERQESEQVQWIDKQSQEVTTDSKDGYNSAPWVVRHKPKFGSAGDSCQNSETEGEEFNGFVELLGHSDVEEAGNAGDEISYGEKFARIRIDDDEDDDVRLSNSVEKKSFDFGRGNDATLNGNAEEKGKDFGGVSNDYAGGGSVELPWRSEGDGRKKRSNTELAERIIPEHELKRLRNVALRMLERTKVGDAGITEALVASIHEKWKVDEVVKLKFEGPQSMNMKMTQEILESRTGGLVIWRSGSSIVLYRGMSYKLPCVQLFNEQTQATSARETSSFKAEAPYLPDFAKHPKDLSDKELMDIDNLLDELGPRFKDWSGREPVPVDADLLPSVVPDYKTPFRLLPHGVRPCLRNKEMTNFRQLARTIPPHFALGRNRKLQGLAQAMVRLWERSAIAKIAIKRGVLNTCNDRMAEELKNLTGGTLLSRNKDFIVFYRGNDFLPPAVKEALEARLKLTNHQQNEEEQMRQLASSSISSSFNDSKCSLVAGTLAETLAATSRWGIEPSSEDVEQMIRDSSLNRHELLVRSLEKKLALAKRKVRKAERSLAKLQENLDPSDLPSDLETVSDEERFLFRKMGLSMKPYLLLGRRGIFDGTVENMHLHWKHRELVKLIVRGRSFLQVKHLAISLEAESGGVLVSVDKTPKGYAIIVYRGKNYQRPNTVRPRNLLTRRQALARSIELQRREALKHHILDLQERIELLKSELEGKKNGEKKDERNNYSHYNASTESDVEETDEEEADAYLEVYDSENEDASDQNE